MPCTDHVPRDRGSTAHSALSTDGAASMTRRGYRTEILRRLARSHLHCRNMNFRHSAGEVVVGKFNADVRCVGVNAVPDQFGKRSDRTRASLARNEVIADCNGNVLDRISHEINLHYATQPRQMLRWCCDATILER